MCLGCGWGVLQFEECAAKAEELFGKRQYDLALGFMLTDFPQQSSFGLSVGSPKFPLEVDQSRTWPESADACDLSALPHSH
eukprot:3955663-Amphidinium_carterae.1